jgi:hypothetical protein
MVVRIDDVEPNVFPAVDATDVVRSTDGKLDIVLIVRIDGNAARVRVRLERSKAQKLSDQLIAALAD